MEPVATRHLRWTDERDSRDVIVRIWVPAQRKTDWVCDFAIDGLPDAVRAHAAGVDSMQALQLAFEGIRRYLEPHAEQLSFLDMQGEHFFPMLVNHYDRNKRREIERLVEVKIERDLERQMRPLVRRMAALAARVDPSGSEEDFARRSVAELVGSIGIAETKRVAHENDGDENAALYFGEKRRRLFAELARRPEHRDAMRLLVANGDRSVRLHAAQHLWMFDATPLERLRREGVEPEASEAAKMLDYLEMENARPKPWDDVPPGGG